MASQAQSGTSRYDATLRHVILQPYLREIFEDYQLMAMLTEFCRRYSVGDPLVSEITTDDYSLTTREYRYICRILHIHFHPRKAEMPNYTLHMLKDIRTFELAQGVDTSDFDWSVEVWKRVKKTKSALELFYINKKQLTCRQLERVICSEV